MANPYSDQHVAALRTLLDHYKAHDCRYWRVVAKRLKDQNRAVPEYKLKRFSSKERTPSVGDLNRIYLHLEEFVGSEDSQSSPVHDLCKREVGLLFSHLRPIGLYSSLKLIANLDDDEQLALSEKLEGTYLNVRRHGSSGFMLSHVLVMDTYRKQGLPTCRISRLRRDEDGHEQGDLVVEGVVFTKNRNISMFGYDNDAGDIRTLTLKRAKGEFTSLRGLVCGFEPDSSAFSAKTVMQRFPEHKTYESIRENTGFFSSTEDVVDILKRLFAENVIADLAERIDALTEASFLEIAVSR